jgi:hypothetical protein
MGGGTGVFQRLLRTAQRIGRDITQFRNLESYFIIAMVVLFLFVTTFGEGVSENDRWNLVLAALALLLFNLTIPKNEVKTLDDFLQDRSTLGAFPERITKARKLWIYAPSASNLLRGDNVDAIRRTVLAYPDGEMRVIIQNPANQPAVDILVRQLDKSLDYQLQHMPDELQNTLRQFAIIESWKVTGKFGYRLLDYSPGFNIVAIDPHLAHGVVLVEFHGFHNESNRSRMNLEIRKSDSERWFMYWVSQFEYMWQDAQPPQPPAS